MALHNKVQFYLSVFENINLISNKPVSDGLFPRFTSLFAYHELVDDGDGNMIPSPTPTPNATFGNRIRYNLRKPNERQWNTEITNYGVSKNAFVLKDGVLPAETERIYIMIPIRPELDESMGEIISEIERDMRPALATALGRSIDWYQFGVVTAEQINAFFDKPSEE